MIIKGTEIEIPDNLIVEGDLDLRGTQVTELPADLVVHGCLDLRHTAINELHEGLFVGWYLDIVGTNITELPTGLTVNIIFANHRQLHASEKVQLGLIAKGDNMLRVFKAPTQKAQRLHDMMWKI